MAEWWWTVARFDSRCDECGEMVPEGTRFAFYSTKNPHQRIVYCELCADSMGVAAECRLSKRARQRSLL
jgi:hypothetical protein